MGGRSQGAIWIAGHEPEVLRDGGVAAAMNDLGAPVRVVDLWGAPQDGGAAADEASDVEARVLVVEVLDRPDLLRRALKSLRRAGELREAPVLAVVGPRSMTQLDPASGHDDFLAWPAPPAELYARVRQLEWRASAYATDEVVKLGPLVIDVARREVSIAGGGPRVRDAENESEHGPAALDEADHAGHEGSRAIVLTARELALLLALATRRGRVLTRATLLDVVWGADYDGGAKTVDVHVRRLRAKLGEALALQTVRGAGYVLR